MSMELFDQLTKKRAELLSWWNLRKQQDFSQGAYSLRVDVLAPSMVAYCGQAYAGAKNYHDAPTWFRETVRKAMADEAKEITVKAVQSELASLTERIEGMKARILAEFAHGESGEIKPPTRLGEETND